MNVAFVIDNSVSMSQRAYNGLSLCEIAKNGVEFMMRQRLRSTESKFDTYHLLQSGIDVNQKGYPNGLHVLSSYKHELSHFFFQLKNIRTHITTDLPDTLENGYKLFNLFRYLNSADNINGGRDPAKSDPSLVILFTDSCCDYFQLEKIQQIIRKGRMGQKWDSTIVLFQLMLPSLIERTVIDQETYRNQLIQNSPSAKIFEDIANALGGCSVLVESYEHLFQAIDSIALPIFAKNRLNCYLQTACRTESEQPNFIDSGMKDFFNPIHNPLLPSKDMVIIKINTKLNRVFQQSKYKYEIQNQQFSRILLPDKPAKMDEESKKDLIMNEYPRFMVDFSKLFHANMNKELEFEKQEVELGEWTRLIAPQITPFVKEKAYFPLYSSTDTKFNWEEPSPSQQMLIGLFKVNVRDGQIVGIDFLYNMWNFLEFNTLYDEILSKRNIGAGPPFSTQVEQEIVGKIERYCAKTPVYYFPTLRKIFVDKGIQSLLDRKYTFLYAETLFTPEYQEFCKQMLRFKSKERKKLDEITKQNRFNHSIKKSTCCAPNSENYEYLNRVMHPKSSHRVEFENLLLEKEEVLFGKAIITRQSSASLEEEFVKRIHFKSEPVSKMSELLRSVKQLEFRDPDVDEEEVKSIKEPMPFGNPFKIVLRIKNTRFSNKASELLSSEENYLNTSMNPSIKASQNILLNRMPKLRKLKSPFSNEPDLRKKIKASPESIFTQQTMDDENQQSPLSDEQPSNIYQDYSNFPLQFNESHSGNMLISQSPGNSDSSLNQDKCKDEEFVDDEDDEQNDTLRASFQLTKTPELNNLTTENDGISVFDSQVCVSNKQENDIEDQQQQQYEQEEEEEEEVEEEEDEEEEYNSDMATNLLLVVKDSIETNKTMTNNNSKQSNKVIPFSGYNPDSDPQEECYQLEQKNSFQQSQPIKKYVYNDQVYNVQKPPSESFKQEEDEYNSDDILQKESEKRNDQDQKNQFNLIKIEFSTKYLLSPKKRQHDFLLSQKEFFQNLLIIQQAYTREDLKLFVQKQLKTIADAEFKEIFKQRVSDIVYIDKKSSVKLSASS